jgi:meiotically up-regulated gene 157 (Mug157) protein
MSFARVVAIAALAIWSQAAVATPATASETTALTTKLERIYLTAYDEAINRHAVAARDGTTYVSTGDIQAEWLRDASAIMMPYVGLAATDPQTARTLRGVIAREARYITIDPYANAFSIKYKVIEEKFEVDSLLYPIWLAARYWRTTGDRSAFTPQVNRAFERVLAVLRTEQHHGRRSHYRNPQLVDGRGSPVRDTGMIWTGFRPSDDPCRYQFNIPVNMFAVVVLRDLTAIERNVYHNGKNAANAWGLAEQIQRGIEQYGTLELRPFGRMYAYEVDGMGHANVMDDANLPSLLSAPYFGYLPARDPLYLATRSFALSNRNPYYFTGRYASGIGSPHTPRGYIWPLALIVEALTATSTYEVQRSVQYLAASDVGDHRLHESFSADWPEKFTRNDFAWPNALYAELVLRKRGKPETAAVSPEDAAAANLRVR